MLAVLNSSYRLRVSEYAVILFCNHTAYRRPIAQASALIMCVCDVIAMLVPYYDDGSKPAMKALRVMPSIKPGCIRVGIQRRTY